MPDERREVDARFILANERTMLAWTRTSLALLAAGVGTLELIDASWRIVPGIALLLLGAGASIVGYLRHESNDRALRRGGSPERTHAPAVLTLALVAVAGFLIVVFLIDAVR